VGRLGRDIGERALGEHDVDHRPVTSQARLEAEPLRDGHERCGRIGRRYLAGSDPSTDLDGAEAVVEALGEDTREPPVRIGLADRPIPHPGPTPASRGQGLRGDESGVAEHEHVLSHRRVVHPERSSQLLCGTGTVGSEQQVEQRTTGRGRHRVCAATCITMSAVGS
jgi:hypothetical protein